MVARALLRSVIAVSIEVDAVVAAAVEVEMSVDAIEDRIAPESEKSEPVTEKVFDPALETVAVATPAPIFVASVPSEVTARSSKAGSLIR